MTVKKRTGQSIMEQVNMDAIEEFCRQIYYVDPYTAMHAEHVAELMAGLASQMFFSSEEISFAYMVGVLHDVGKIRTPEHILTKPAKLTQEEYEIMKRHSEDGAKMLSAIEGAAPIAQIMRHHHERFDGKGYPDGLRGGRIPLYSRMLAVCDTEIQRCAGAQFDPEVCEAFIDFVADRFGFVIAKETKEKKIAVR